MKGGGNSKPEIVKLSHRSDPSEDYSEMSYFSVELNYGTGMFYEAIRVTNSDNMGGPGYVAISSLMINSDITNPKEYTIGLTNVYENNIDTAVGTVKLCGTTSRDSTGFIKMYVGTSACYVPYFSEID
jgi:hypothetical protein